MSKITTQHTVPHHAVSQSELQSDPYPCLIKLSRPYFTPEILEALHRTTGFRGPYSTHHVLQGCNLIWVIGTHFKFPVKTMGTASIIFQRIYLFNAPAALPLLDTALACLMISSKIEDTPKKSRELCLTGYNLRSPFNPNTVPIVIHSNATSDTNTSSRDSGGSNGNNDEGNNNTGTANSNSNDPGSQQLEEIRMNVINLERQILESLCFDFRIKHPQRLIIQFAKDLNSLLQVPCSSSPSPSLKTLAKLAWHLSIDTYKTAAPLKHTPNTIAMACLILAYFMLNRSVVNPTIPKEGQGEGEGEGKQYNKNDQFGAFLISIQPAMAKYFTTATHVNAAILDLLDLYIDHAAHSHLILYTPYKLTLHDFIHIKILVNTAFDKLNLDKGENIKQPHYLNEREADEVVVKHMRVRDPSISDKGSVRYVLENQLDKLTGESVF